MNTATLPDNGFQTANPHALASILEASETRSIIAATDIFDIHGVKLWAKNQPVSRDLQQKLMDRALSKPLESTLLAEDGVRAETLKAAIERLINTQGPLHALLHPHATALLKNAAAVRLHPVAQLLLSVCETSRPESYAHAVQAMATAGAMMVAQSKDDRLIALAMTAGLLHDIGEMYVAPEHGEADAAHASDVESLRQLVVHPHIGQLLLSQLTDYPRDLIRAVAEHHEHLDGSGYPHLLSGDKISPLGRLLAATEEVLAALREPGANLHHASVAVRVVPGEFDEHMAGPLMVAARQVPPLAPKSSATVLRANLHRLDSALQQGLLHLQEWMPEDPSHELKGAAELTGHMLQKLRTGWNESGLWFSGSVTEGAEQAEAEAVQDALRARLQLISRMARLNAGPLEEEEQATLDRFCHSLTEV